MQTKLNYPTQLSHLPNLLETLAIRLTAQLVEVSAHPDGCDPDLFGKIQRNLNGILRSLANIEKRLETNAATPPVNPMDQMEQMEPVAPVAPKKPSPPSSSPETPICVSVVKTEPPQPQTPPKNPPKQTPSSSVVKIPSTPAANKPASPSRRPSKAERRLLKKARRNQLAPRNPFASPKTPNLVQTSEQNPQLDLAPPLRSPALGFSKSLPLVTI